MCNAWVDFLRIESIHNGAQHSKFFALVANLDLWNPLGKASAHVLPLRACAIKRSLHLRVVLEIIHRNFISFQIMCLVWRTEDTLLKRPGPFAISWLVLRNVLSTLTSAHDRIPHTVTLIIALCNDWIYELSPLLFQESLRLLLNQGQCLWGLGPCHYVFLNNASPSSHARLLI